MDLVCINNLNDERRIAILRKWNHFDLVILSHETHSRKERMDVNGIVKCASKKLDGSSMRTKNNLIC